MFVALEIKAAPPGGIIPGILNILTMPKLELELRQVLGARYIAACTAPSRRGVDWASLVALCARYRDKVLLPEGLLPPEGSGLDAPLFPGFRRQVLLDTACAIIEHSRMPMYRRVLGFVDPAGAYVSFLPVLLRHFTSVRVFTRELELYTREQERMMEQLGAPVLVSDSFTGFTDCVLALCPDSLYGYAPELLRCPVVADEGLLPPGPCDYITGLEPPVDPAVAAACPEGISPQEFTAALYEFAGLKDVPTVADRMLYNHKFSSLDEVSGHVLARAGYPRKLP